MTGEQLRQAGICPRLCLTLESTTSVSLIQREQRSSPNWLYPVRHWPRPSFTNHISWTPLESHQLLDITSIATIRDLELIAIGPVLQHMAEWIMPIIRDRRAADVTADATSMVVGRAFIPPSLQVGVADENIVRVCHLERSMKELPSLPVADRTSAVIANQKDAVVVCICLATIKSEEGADDIALIAPGMDFI